MFMIADLHCMSYIISLLAHFNTDIPECERDEDNCDSNATCFNTDGGFYCLCNAGYTGSGEDGDCKGAN